MAKTQVGKQQNEKLWRKLQLVYTYLNKPDRWFTGLALKRYLHNEVFGLLNRPLNNSTINSGRWSAYCYYSLTKAFENLLDKHQLPSQSVIMAHPLLPSELVQILLDRKHRVISLDIDKSTLNWAEAEFQNYLQNLKSQNQLPQLIIHYLFNGLYAQACQNLTFAQQMTIPSLIFLDNQNTNLDFFKIVEGENLGSFLWQSGDSFWDDELQIVTKTSLKSQKWYFCWYLETRTSSVLEYNLSQSQGSFFNLIEAYFYLLVQKYGQKGFKAKIYTWFVENYLLKNKFGNPKKAEQILTEEYQKVLQGAVGDIVFDLYLDNKTENANQIVSNPKLATLRNSLLDLESFLHNLGKMWQQYFLTYLEQRPKGSLEVPEFYLQSSYLEYFIYTTESSFWSKQLNGKKAKIRQLDLLHEIFTNSDQFPNANFAVKYYLGIILI